MGSSVRISEKSHQVLREMARQSGQSMPDVLDKAIEEYRRKKILESANAAYAALRSNPEAWQDELEERAAWDATLNDGLKDD